MSDEATQEQVAEQAAEQVQEQAAEVTSNDKTDKASKKAKGKKEKDVEVPAEEGFVFFASANVEVSSYDIVVAQESIRATWDTKRERLVFRVPTALADRFRQHDHVKTGRVVEVEEV